MPGKAALRGVHWVLADVEVRALGPLHDMVHALAHPARRLRYLEPDWLQHGEHVAALDRINRPVADHRKHMSLQRTDPVLHMHSTLTPAGLEVLVDHAG